MNVTDEDFYWHMSWVKGEKSREAVRDMVAYLQMGGYHFPTENPMRAVSWVALMVGQGKVYDWESEQWVRKGAA